MGDYDLDTLWDRYPGAMEELEEYVDPETVGVDFDVIPKEDKASIEHWLRSKVELEGPPDQDTIEKFAKKGKIEKPIIIDTRNDYTVEGKHRLATALRYNFDVPALIIFDDGLQETFAQKLAQTLGVFTEQTSKPTNNIWYHGSQQKFDQFKQKPWQAFDRKTVESPIWLTPDKEFASMHAGPKGWMYAVAANPKKTFPTKELLKWDGPYLLPTPYGEKLIEDMLARRMFNLDVDDWFEAEQILKSIERLDYDILETSDFISWLKDNGYDSFLVKGDGPTNIAILDPSRIEIVSRKPNSKLNESELKQFYGSNFQHTLKGYTQKEDGLATHGVHYSDYQKWGIAPQGQYFPKGVYFYYLSGDCNAAIGNGFATNRKWANVARIDNNKMVILKQGHPQNFSKVDLQTSLRKLEKELGNIPVKEVEGSKFKRVSDSNPSFKQLGNILSGLEKQGHGSFNKLLKMAGYSGIVDYDQELLPVESCQGVVTWPDGAELVESVPTPNKSPGNKERLSKMLTRLQYEQNGALELSADEIREVITMLPDFYHVWDISDSKMDFLSLLLQKLNFNYQDAVRWLERKDWFGDRFYMELEKNPTTPKEYWEQMLHSPDIHGARAAAKNMLGECFSVKRWAKLAGLLTEEQEVPPPKHSVWYHGTREEIKGDLRPIYLSSQKGLAKLHGNLYQFKLDPDAKWLDISKVFHYTPSIDSFGYIDGAAEEYRNKGYDVVWDSGDYHRGHEQIFVINPDVVEMMKITEGNLENLLADLLHEEISPGMEASGARLLPIDHLWEINKDNTWESGLSPYDIITDSDMVHVFINAGGRAAKEAQYDVDSVHYWMSKLRPYVNREKDIPKDWNIFVEDNGEIVDGYHRLTAAIAVGLDEFPIVGKWSPKLTEEISPDTEEQILNADPNDIITVYHGTPKFRLPELINGFDATAVRTRDYGGQKHPGLFVTPDFEVAKSFGGGAVIEIKVRAKNLHGTDYTGNIGRVLKKRDSGLADWAQSKFPNSFRPYMAMTMLQNVEPQALLVGLVKPSKITRVWVKNLESKTWDEYTREEFLKSDMEFSAGQQKMKKFGDAGIDLSSPNLTMRDVIQAIADAEGYGPDKVESAMKFAEMRAQHPERLRQWLETISIHGSRLGEKAVDSIVNQMTEKVDESTAPLESLLEYLLVEGRTQTDETLEKVLQDWVEHGKRAPKGPHWFPPRELFRYREFHRRSRPDLQKSMKKKGFDPKYPIQLLFGKNGVVMVAEGNHRLKTAIQLDIDKIPVEFSFQKKVEKWQDKEDQYNMMKDKERIRQQQAKKRKEAEDRKLGLDSMEKLLQQQREKRKAELAAMSSEEREKEEEKTSKQVEDIMDLLGF